VSSRSRILVLVALLVAPQSVAAAGSEEAASFTGPLAHNLEGAGSKLVALAEAIPADKYSWRPSPEVRSVSEVGRGPAPPTAMSSAPPSTKP